MYRDSVTSCVLLSRVTVRRAFTPVETTTLRLFAEA